MGLGREMAQGDKGPYKKRREEHRGGSRGCESELNLVPCSLTERSVSVSV